MFCAFLCYMYLFLSCVWNNPPRFFSLSIFSLRGLFVEVMACWCLRLSLGPYCWCFFPHSHTHAHSGPLLLTLNFILCCSCICCHHGDLVYYLTPLALKHTNTHTHNTIWEIGRLRLPLCLIWCYRAHRIAAPSKPGPLCTNTHTAVGLDWMQQAHAKHRAISSTLPNHLQAGLDNDIC